MKTRIILLLLTAVLSMQGCIRQRPDQRPASEPTSQLDSIIRDVDFNLGGHTTLEKDYVIADIDWVPGGYQVRVHFNDVKVPAHYNGDQIIILVKDRTISFVDKDGEVNLITGDFRIYNIRRH